MRILLPITLACLPFIPQITGIGTLPTTTTNCASSLIGGPTMTDTQAAQQITPATSPMDSSNAPMNQPANQYEVAIYHSRAPQWAQRVDGQCPNGLTTPEVLQWAANKWGINPILAYAEAELESGWSQNAIGDSGGSHGIFQVNDAVANRPGGASHGDPALAGLDIARTSTCFNADLWAGRIWAAYNGVTGGAVPSRSINAAIQSWFDGIYKPQNGGNYSALVCGLVADDGYRSLLR